MLKSCQLFRPSQEFLMFKIRLIILSLVLSNHVAGFGSEAVASRPERVDNRLASIIEIEAVSEAFRFSDDSKALDCLKKYPEAAHKINCRGYFPLHLAAIYRNVPATDWLLTHDVIPTHTNHNGQTPLILAKELSRRDQFMVHDEYIGIIKKDYRPEELATIITMLDAVEKSGKAYLARPKIY